MLKNDDDLYHTSPKDLMG